MSMFGSPFWDFDGDGIDDVVEAMVGMQITASSRAEAIELTGGDEFYLGDDDEDDDEF